MHWVLIFSCCHKKTGPDGPRFLFLLAQAYWPSSEIVSVEVARSEPEP